MVKEVERLAQRAQQAVSQGKNEIARQYYEKAIELRPSLPNLHYGLATVCYLMNDLDSAVDHFRRVTKLDPLRAGAFINLGAVFNKLGMLDDAVSALRKGIQLDLNRPEGYYNLGLVYRKKQQLELAIQAYREATRVEPRMADAHYNLANLYLEKGQYNLAVAHYEESIDLRPNWVKARDGLESARAALEDELNELDDGQVSFDEIEENEDPTLRMLDPERTVDPERHGKLLSDLHRATKETEKISEEFVQLLQAEIEPAIRILSNCLLQSDQSSVELDQCVEKLESGLQKMSSGGKQIQKNMKFVKANGEKLLES